MLVKTRLTARTMVVTRRMPLPSRSLARPQPFGWRSQNVRMLRGSPDGYPSARAVVDHFFTVTYVAPGCIVRFFAIAFAYRGLAAAACFAITGATV
jgi:hypothetical protein